MTLVCALLSTGCSSVAAGGGGGDSSSGSGEPDTGAPPTGGDSDPGVTGPEPGDDTTSGSSGTGSSDTVSSGTGSNETGSDDSGSGDSGSDDTGPALPMECSEVDPTVSAAFALELAAWAPDPNPSSELEAACTVDDVNHVDDMVVTELTCEIDGAPAPAILSIADSLEGPTDWAAGDAVQLSAQVWDEGDFGNGRNVALRRPDGALLVCAGEGLIDSTFIQRCQPLTITVADACPGSQDGRLRLDFESADAAVSVFHGHRGLLSIAVDTAHAIEVEQAQHTTDHEGDELKVLVRRVKLGR